MIITFLGHRRISGYDDLSERIQKTIFENINPKEETFFYCGGYGEFDSLCAKACRLVTGRIPNIQIVFVTPYMTEQQQKKVMQFIRSGLYDSVIYPPLEMTPPRFAIRKRNEWMINEADLIIAYVKQTYGGAFTAMDYARRKKKHVINIADTH